MKSVETVQMDRTYVDGKSFNVEGLATPNNKLYWLPVGVTVRAMEEVTLKFRGGGGSSEWKDSVTLQPGDGLRLISGGNPATAAVAEVVRRIMGYKEAWGLVADACYALSEGETRDYTLKEVAAKCGGSNMFHAQHDCIMLNGVPVQMRGDPTWAEMGNQFSIRKQHYPKV